MSCRWTCSGCFKPWRGSRGTILTTFTTRRRPAGCRSGPARIRARRTGPRGGTIRTSTCCTSRPTARYRYSSRAASRSYPLTGRCCSTCRRMAASPPSSIRKKVSVPFDTATDHASANILEPWLSRSFRFCCSPLRCLSRNRRRIGLYVYVCVGCRER